MKTINVNSYAVEGEYSVAGAEAYRLFGLGYKAMKDSAGKPKSKPDNVSVAVRLLAIPSCGSVDIDAISRNALEGFQDDLVRSLRAGAGNPTSGSLEEDAVNLSAVLAYAAERGLTLKLTESAIAAWFESEGKAAVLAHWCAAKNVDYDESDPMQAKLAASCAVIFCKLAAPVPDVSAAIAAIMLTKLSVLEGSESSAVTQAIRRKLQSRIKAAEDAESTLAMLEA